MIDYKIAKLNAETAERARQALEKKDAWAEVHKHVESEEKMQARYDALLKEHISLYGKYVTILAGGPISKDVEKVLSAVDTYYQTLMGPTDKIDAVVLTQRKD